MSIRSKADLPAIRAALWATRALRLARRRLQSQPVEQVVVPLPPALPPSAERGLWAVVRRTDPTCLERAVVLQAWRRRQGVSRDVVIGVRGTGDDFEAHAWLDGEPDPQAAEFLEITRVART
jgi:Transglutaminase-like superfamily